MPTQLESATSLSETTKRTTMNQPAGKEDRTGSVSIDPAVQRIIATARQVSHRVPARGAWLLGGTTALLLWASFTPLDWGPLGWLALVPLIQLVRIPHPSRWMYRAVYLTGLGFWLVTFQWMRLGDPTMVPAWGALAIYLAVYFPVFVLLCRTAVQRFSLPLTLTVPVVWVGLEFVRAYLVTGCSWYYLGHTQHRWIELIQISDLVGAYGVSFVVALAAASLAGLVPLPLLKKLRLLSDDVSDHAGREANRSGPIIAVAVSLLVFVAVLGYGYVRRSQADFHDGPRIALIQGNFTTAIKHDPGESQRIFDEHYRLTGLAVREQPDLIVWPETMYRSPLLSAEPDLSEDDLRSLAPRIDPRLWRESGVPRALSRLSRQTGAALLLGIDTGTLSAKAGFRRYNSAAFVRPETGFVGRYDKIHRVLFGEYIPLKDEFPWLAKLTPFPDDFGIAAGNHAVVFDLKQWRIAPIICFEDTVPHLVREIVKTAADNADGKPVDCLVNLTNDGWFHGSSELDQHLITAAFRSVETRTPMVRAVNTGISAVIDGDGVVVEPDVFFDGDGKGRTAMRDQVTGRWNKGLNAVLVDNVPLDDRRSLYVAGGDWFAGTCGFLCLFLLAGSFRFRRRTLAESSTDRV